MRNVCYTCDHCGIACPEGNMIKLKDPKHGFIIQIDIKTMDLEPQFVDLCSGCALDIIKRALGGLVK